MPSSSRKKGKETKVIKRFQFRIDDSPPSVVGEEASYVTPRVGEVRKVSIPSSSSSLSSAAFVPTIASAAKAVGGYSKFVLNRKDWKSLIDENRQQHAEENERRWQWERRERHPSIFQTRRVEQPAIIADLGQVEQRPQTAATTTTTTTTTTLNKPLLLESLGLPKRRCTFRDPEASFKCETTCADARLPMLVGMQTMSDHPKGANATNPKLENAGPVRSIKVVLKNLFLSPLEPHWTLPICFTPHPKINLPIKRIDLGDLLLTCKTTQISWSQLAIDLCRSDICEHDRDSLSIREKNVQVLSTISCLGRDIVFEGTDPTQLQTWFD
jgi:hypothetical protein